MRITILTTSEQLNGALELVRHLIETRSFRKERLADSDVKQAFDTLREAAATGPAEARLTAVSTLGKAGEISKPIQSAVQQALSSAFETELPLLGSWGNAEDRYYLAKAISASDANWVPAYAAVALAHSEIAEKLSRDLWAELAITRAQSLSSALQRVSEALSQWLGDREEVIELGYRKVVRVCEALTRTLLTADVPSGQRFGLAFGALARLAGGGRGADVLRLREETAIAVLDLVVQVLRLRFDVLFDSDLYRAVGTVRGWWRPGRPPEEVERRTDRIADLAIEGLHILARQGVKDKELRLALSKSLEAARVNAAGSAIAASDPSLDPGISRWLATGQELAAARSSEAAKEINDQVTDDLVGQLLLSVTSQDVSPDTINSVADALELFEPNQAAIVRKAVGRIELIRQWIDALAAKRRLNIYSTRGELVPFDPLLHDSAQPLQRKSNVRVAVPGVLREFDGRPPEIVVKALVERI